MDSKPSSRLVDADQNIESGRGLAKAKIKKGKKWTGNPSGPWITARKVIQYLALVGFIVLFIASRSALWPPTLINFPMRLDPLAVIVTTIASREFLAGSALAFLTLALTIVFGRAWCGWLCPLGTVLDIVTPKRSKKIQRGEDKAEGISDNWRKVKYVILLLILLMAVLGSQNLMFLDPLTLLFRSLTVSLWPALDRMVLALEMLLYRVPFLSNPIVSLDSILRPYFLPSEQVFYRSALGFGAVFAGVIALNWIAPRFWCRYLCPLGGLLGLISKGSLYRREVGEDCKDCQICSAACPTGTIDAKNHFASDPSECTMCLDCLETCPRTSIAFQPKLAVAEWKEYDPGRREALFSLGGAILALALFKSEWTQARLNIYRLRPPGSIEADLMSRCIRCGECLRACPTSALQPSVSEAGWEGLWTPILITRLGYCDYSCNACGQTCPVKAIPPLTLEDKRQQVIGRAYIDKNRCLPWADGKDCIVCEEMCPIPEKAVQLDEVEAAMPDGSTRLIKLPKVLRDRCIGCGICEYKCPLQGEAAIRVRVDPYQIT